MRLAIIALLALISVQAQANGRAYLNTEDGEVVSVFNKPGMNWKNCLKDKECRAIAWPDRTAEIEVVSDVKKMIVEDPYTEDKISEEEYVQITYKYERTVKGQVIKQEGKGWIDNAYVAREKQKTFFGKAERSGSPAMCSDKDYPSSEISKLKDSMSDIQKTIANNGVTGTADAVKPFVGACVIDPKKTQTYAKGNPYDNYVLPKVSKQKLPNIQKENGQQVTAADMVAIDALSRTLYAEMAGCYKNGLQYPMTVAKIAVNRAETPARHREFIKDDHNSSKTDLAKVVTSPSQFSLWLKTINGKPNKSLKHALCPPSEKDKRFWNGNLPSQQEIDIWDNTVKIATEAVLFPEKFGKRTSKVKQFFYTSGMPSFYGMSKVRPTIEDRKVEKESCIQVWEEKKKG